MRNEPFVSSKSEMDHIPDVSDAAYPIDQVPLLIEDVDLYDGPDLSFFPQRKGFTSGEQLLRPPRERRMLYAITLEAKCLSSRRKGSIIQSWLFMGPLVEVFHVVGIDIDFSDFMQDRRWIMTRALESYIQRWENFENHRGAEERESHGHDDYGHSRKAWSRGTNYLFNFGIDR